jgi:hypothetical protein
VNNHRLVVYNHQAQHFSPFAFFPEPAVLLNTKTAPQKFSPSGAIFYQLCGFTLRNARLPPKPPWAAAVAAGYRSI